MTTPNLKALIPKRGEATIVDGVFSRGPQVFMEEVARRIEPNNVGITSSNSPYYAQSGDRILCDMSSSDITIVMPSSGDVVVSRKGASNTLTLQGTINGTVNPTIAFDGTTASMAYFGGEWRYV